MKVNFDAKLKTLDGSDLTDARGDVFTLKNVCTTALSQPMPGKEKDGESKARAGELMYRIYASNGQGLDLKTDDITFIKKHVGSFHTPIIVHQAWEMLEGK